MASNLCCSSVMLQIVVSFLYYTNLTGGMAWESFPLKVMQAQDK